MFALIMMAATTFGFAKVILMAWVLPEADFGFYISGLGVATFLGIVLSFGRIEATTKIYSILVLQGSRAELLEHIGTLSKVLFRRTIIAGAVAAGGISLYPPQNLWGFGGAEIALIFALGGVLALLALLASVLRALAHLRLLQAFTIARGFFVLLIAVPLATVFPWRIVLLSEGVALLVVTALFWRFVLRCISALRSDTNAARSVAGGDVDQARAEAGGRVIFWANLCAAILPYGGRVLVLALAGPVVAGAFGLITTLVQVGVMLAGALAQKLGPNVIKVVHTQGGVAVLMQLITLPVFLMASLSILAFVAFTTSLFIPVFASFWAGYGITAPMLGLVALHLFLPSYLFLQFGLIAIDREVDLLWAAVLAVATFAVGNAVCIFFGFGLFGYMITFFLADFARSLYGSFAIWRMKSQT